MSFKELLDSVSVLLKLCWMMTLH